MTYPAVGKNADLRPRRSWSESENVHAVEARRAMGFDRGAYDTLNWLITGGDGPLTGQMVGLPRPAAAIVRELAAAEAILSGTSSLRHVNAVVRVAIGPWIGTRPLPCRVVAGNTMRSALTG